MRKHKSLSALFLLIVVLASCIFPSKTVFAVTEEYIKLNFNDDSYTINPASDCEITVSGGKITWDSENYILSLDNVILEGVSNENVIDIWMNSPVKLKLVGTNKINTGKGFIKAVYSLSDLIITGKGSLTIGESGSLVTMGIIRCDAALTISSGNIRIKDNVNHVIGIYSANRFTIGGGIINVDVSGGKFEAVRVREGGLVIYDGMASFTANGTGGAVRVENDDFTYFGGMFSALQTEGGSSTALNVDNEVYLTGFDVFLGTKTNEYGLVNSPDKDDIKCNRYLYVSTPNPTRVFTEPKSGKR